MSGQPEAFSRVLIDRALRDSGWDLLNPQQVRFELSGSSGRADYVLSGRHGPLCVLEAKRPDIDPYEAKEETRGYAENLRAPFVILSDGTEHWFWNYERADQRDAYRIERFPSPDDIDTEIELLLEYRTRLIADVVTGKLDMREAAANLPEEPDEPEPLDEEQIGHAEQDLMHGDGETEEIADAKD